MTNSPQQPPAGWYPDPAGSGGERFWDGAAWSQSTRDAAPEAPSYHQAPHVEPQYQQYQQPQTQQPYAQQGYAGYGTPYGPTVPRTAGFWWRLLGYIIDGFLIGIVTQLLNSALGFSGRLSIATEVWMRDLLIWAESQNPNQPVPLPSGDFVQLSVYMAIVGIVVWVIYRVVMYTLKSATLGQMVLGMKLVDARNPEAKLSTGTIVLRAILSPVFYSLSLLGLINGLLAAFSAKKQTLADMIAKTQVFKVR